jgi:hypothetical protein
MVLHPGSFNFLTPTSTYAQVKMKSNLELIIDVDG